MEWEQLSVDRVAGVGLERRPIIGTKTNRWRYVQRRIQKNIAKSYLVIAFWGILLGDFSFGFIKQPIIDQLRRRTFLEGLGRRHWYLIIRKLHRKVQFWIWNAIDAINVFFDALHLSRRQSPKQLHIKITWKTSDGRQVPASLYIKILRIFKLFAKISLFLTNHAGLCSVNGYS